MKKIYQLEQMEKEERFRVEREENILRKTLRKQKNDNDRSLIVKRSQETNGELRKVKGSLCEELFTVIENKVQVSSFIDKSFGLLKAKLAQRERKSNEHGLIGSLLFKIIHNGQSF